MNNKYIEENFSDLQLRPIRFSEKIIYPGEIPDCPTTEFCVAQDKFFSEENNSDRVFTIIKPQFFCITDKFKIDITYSEHLDIKYQEFIIKQLQILRDNIYQYGS